MAIRGDFSVATDIADATMERVFDKVHRIGMGERSRSSRGVGPTGNETSQSDHGRNGQS